MKNILFLLLLVNPCLAQPWWDDFPRMVSDSTANSLNVVTNHHGSFGMNANGQDPSWGTFFQRDGIVRNTAKTDAFLNAGVKQIGYFETYGQSYCLVAELGAWDETNLTPVLNHYWGWANYSGGTIRWLGAKDFFDDEDFARPYTRTHPRYGGPAMTYPDGTMATGYAGPDTDPRNSRVYDAACSKNILGELSIDDIKFSTGPTNGLVYIPEANAYAGLFLLKKDSACPPWDDYTYASTLQAADSGIDGMWTDNYGPWDSLGYNVVQRGFGEWSLARFRDDLTNRFSSVELADLGITNAAVFDIREHLKDVATGWGWDGNDLNHFVWKSGAWLDDPLWRAYLIFKRQVGTEALSNYYATVKSAALAGGKPEFLVAGNDIPGFSLGWCRGDLDMVSTELSMGWGLSVGTAGFTPPPTGRYAPLYKLAREHAKSRFVNVWLYNSGYISELTHPEMVKVLYYEMLATHALPKFDPSNARFAGDEDTNAGFFEFVEQVAPVYGNRIPVEEVGLYYSSSSILRQLTPNGYVNHNSQPHQFGFWGWATALGELHYQYRAVPEWKLTAAMLDSLRVLVVPNADVFDPADVAVLTPWVDNGGRLVITGDSGKYLGESGNFDLNPNGWSIASLTNHANVVHLSSNIGMNYYLAYGNRAPLLSQFSAAMDSALAGAVPAGVTEATVSNRAGLTLYEDETIGKFFIDVNNFDIDLGTYAITGTGAITVEAMLPQALRGKTLRASVVSPQETTPVVELLAAADTNRVRISLGSVDYYAGVVIESMHEWADPAVSGNWNEATRWVPASVPEPGASVLWRYATGNPVVTISNPVEASRFTALRADGASSYWNTGGLKILNHGIHTGSLTVDGGAGVIDMFDGGWFGSRLSVANEDELAAAALIQADKIRVRTFQLDTVDIPSGASYFTHETGDLTVKVELFVGGVSVAGDEAEFRQSNGNVRVEHNEYGLKLGAGLTTGIYTLDGGTTAVSTIEFANANSVFAFNHGILSGGARDGVWKGVGTLQLAGTGMHFIDVEAGRTMVLNAEVQLSDKPGEKGTLAKTGDGTLVVNTASSCGGLVEVQQGVLSLATNGLNPELYLTVRANASVALVFTGTNAVRALSFDEGESWQVAGLWGAPGSGAANENPRFSGTGFLQVGTDQVAPQSWTAGRFSEEEIAAGLAKNDQDPDGDRSNNWQEYVAGTDPLDAASAFLAKMEVGATSVDLSFDSVTGRIYSIYSNTDLVHGAWAMLGTNIPGSGEVIMIVESNNLNKVYYQFKATLP